MSTITVLRTLKVRGRLTGRRYEFEELFLGGQETGYRAKGFNKILDCNAFFGHFMIVN